MLDRVLHERLEDQSRNLGVERDGIDVVIDRVPVLNSRLFGREVRLEELEFVWKRNARGAGSRERNPKKIAQATDHSVRRLGLGVDQGRDSVERVEQEMRM